MGGATTRAAVLGPSRRDPENLLIVEIAGKKKKEDRSKEHRKNRREQKIGF